MEPKEETREADTVSEDERKEELEKSEMALSVHAPV